MVLRPVAPITLAAELRPTVSPDDPALPRPVRNVTPHDMTAPPALSGPLVRIVPPARRGAAGPAPETADRAPQPPARYRRRRAQVRRTRHSPRRHRRAGLRGALRRGRRGLALRAHGARGARPPHPRPRRRMRAAGGSGGDPRSRRLPRRRAEPVGMARRAGLGARSRPRLRGGGGERARRPARHLGGRAPRRRSSAAQPAGVAASAPESDLAINARVSGTP